MQKFLYPLFLILPFSISFAQFSKNDLILRRKMEQNKVVHYQKLMLCEQQKTANQDDYDVKYYSLDLTPDPTTEVLSGVVEVVGEVVAPTLDHVELNF